MKVSYSRVLLYIVVGMIAVVCHRTTIVRSPKVLEAVCSSVSLAVIGLFEHHAQLLGFCNGSLSELPVQYIRCA
jgi:hypothetical protein